MAFSRADLTVYFLENVWAATTDGNMVGAKVLKMDFALVAEKD